MTSRSTRVVLIGCNVVLVALALAYLPMPSKLGYAAGFSMSAYGLVLGLRCEHLRAMRWTCCGLLVVVALDIVQLVG